MTSTDNHFILLLWHWNIAEIALIIIRLKVRAPLEDIAAHSSIYCNPVRAGTIFLLVASTIV